MAQQESEHNFRAPWEVDSFALSLTHQKTTHLLFKADIQYVDLGSNEVIASKVPNALNVLRLKAAKENISATNVTVITSKGGYYNFEVSFELEPKVLSFDFTSDAFFKKSQTGERDIYPTVLLGSSVSELEMVMDSVFHLPLTRPLSKGMQKGVNTYLWEVYVYKDKLVFLLGLENSSSLPFSVEEIEFRVVDRYLKKGSVLQDKVVDIVAYKALSKEVDFLKPWHGVYVLPVFAMDNSKVLEISIKDTSLNRQGTLRIKSHHLWTAKRL